MSTKTGCKMEVGSTALDHLLMVEGMAASEPAAAAAAAVVVPAVAVVLLLPYVSAVVGVSLFPFAMSKSP